MGFRCLCQNHKNIFLKELLHEAVSVTCSPFFNIIYEIKVVIMKRA